MSFRLPIAVIKAQLNYDLIGKDSQRGITLSYGWLANQCGHCMLGYIPTHLLFLLLHHCFHVPSAVWLSVLIISLLWTGFEIYNVIKPLRQQKKQGSLFEPDWKNIISDTATDLGFFITGALLAGLLLGGTWLLAVVGVIIWLFLYPASKYWYHTKIFQQAAEYPFQFRLSQWKWAMPEKDRELVLHFIENSLPGQHLLISGEYKTGKTSLAVAIANELSIKHKRCKYATAIKLFSNCIEPDAGQSEVPGNLWSWRRADCFVIDDLNTGLPHSAELISSEIFMQHIQTGQYAAENMQALLQVRIVWVLGDIAEASIAALHSSWKNMLLQIGLPEQNIYQLHLSKR